MTKKVRIVTDSGCDISREQERLYNIDILPFSVVIDGNEYWERIDLTPQQFYDLANAADGIPKTAQINVARFEQKLRECKEDGVGTVIMPLIFSGGSATFENAHIALENLAKSGEIGDMKVYILDSRGYSLGYGYPVIEGAKKLAAGHTPESVVDFMEDWFASLEIYIIGFDLRFMKKSGRISAAAAFLGELMGLKPVISMIDGHTVVVKKSRGENAAIEDAVKYIGARAVPETPWQLLRTTVPELEERFISGYSKKVGSSPSMDSYCGCVVGANAGTKFIGVLVKGAKRETPVHK